MDHFKLAFKNCLLSNIEIATYDREIERYGGVKLLDTVEDIFFIDSEIAMDILSSIKKNSINFTIDEICFLSIYNYTDLFFNEFNDKIKFFNFMGINKISINSKYKNTKDNYSNLIFTQNKDKEFIKLF